MNCLHSIGSKSLTSYKVVLTPSFKSCIRRLEKRYPNIKDDVRVAIHALLQEPRLGVVIPGGSGVRKLRVRSSDLQRGKRGGFRLLYSLDERSQLIIYLVFIYAKSDREDVTRKELQDLMREIESESE